MPSTIPRLTITSQRTLEVRAARVAAVGLILLPTRAMVVTFFSLLAASPLHQAGYLGPHRPRQFRLRHLAAARQHHHQPDRYQYFLRRLHRPPLGHRPRTSIMCLQTAQRFRIIMLITDSRLFAATLSMAKGAASPELGTLHSVRI